MFSFLNSIVLPALVAVSIPVIIHFFNRRKARKVTFSSVRFLKQIENQRIRQVRLYQILLIIIRSLFILFLILAFARPTLNSGLWPSSGTARTTAVIILDNSYSMNTYNKSTSVFYSALEKLKQILASFQSNDQVFILTTATPNNNSKPIVLNTPNLFKQYPPTKKSPDFKPVLQAAARILEKHPNHNRELYIISDLKITRDMAGDSIPEFFTNKTVRTFLIGPLDNDAANSSIDTVFLTSRLLEVNKPVDLIVRVRNHHPTEPSETRVSLFDKETRVAMQQINLNAGATTDLKLSFIPKAGGLHQLKAELEDDDLLDDNNYYFDLSLASQRKVLVVSMCLQPILHFSFSTQISAPFSR